MTRNSLIGNLFGKKAKLINEFIGKNRNKRVCKNKHFLYETTHGLISVKEFKNLRSGLIESKAYDYFESNNLVKVPQRYYSDKKFLVTDYIHSGDFDLISTISDWSKVHLNTIDQTQFEEVNPIPITLKNLNKQKNLFGGFVPLITERLLGGPKIPLKSITHGDLYVNNTISTKDGNYYIDFESFGIGHPARDLSLLLFNANNKERELVLKGYRRSLKEIYSGDFEEDVYTFWIERLTSIIIGLNKEVNLMEYFKKYYLKRAYSQLDWLLD